MTRKPDPRSLTVEIPSDLDAASVTEVHASLVAALDLAEAGEGEIAVALGDETEPCTPLALQLLVSVTRSFPADTLTIDARGMTALQTLKTA